MAYTKFNKSPFDLRLSWREDNHNCIIEGSQYYFYYLFFFIKGLMPGD